MALLNGKRGKGLAKAALAKTQVIQVDMLGDYSDEASKFQSLNNSFGVTYDANNNVQSNNTKTLTLQNEADILLLEAKVVAMANLFGIAFDTDGNITAEDYTTHTHEYVDGTIADTGDGTGLQTDTTKNTSGVN